MKPYYQDNAVTIYHGDCRAVLPTLPKVDLVLTDPPYGMGKAEWDNEIPKWLPLVDTFPVMAFCGVVGMRDYPTPDWVAAWVRVGSTQRIGHLGGFNNWEPILCYRLERLPNDVFMVPNTDHKHQHPTCKPLKLFLRLVSTQQAHTILDPFMGSGTTLRAAKDLGRKAIGIEIEEKYCEIAAKRMAQEVLAL